MAVLNFVVECFLLLVFVAPCLPALEFSSDIANGQGLTLATAGVRARFTIFSRDIRNGRNGPIFDIDFLDSALNRTRSLRSAQYPWPCQWSEGLCITAVNVLSGGTGCTSGGSLTASGIQGGGFAAQFSQQLGSIADVTILSTGSGYANASLSIASGGANCSGYSLEVLVDGSNQTWVSYLVTVSGTFRLQLVAISPGGLRANFFGNTILAQEPLTSRIDTTVNFLDGIKFLKPNDANERIPWSANWEGKVQSADSGESTFIVRANGGVRLWVDANLLISSWETSESCSSKGICSKDRGSHSILSHNAGASRIVTAASCPGYDWTSTNSPFSPIPQQLRFEMPLSPALSKFPTYLSNKKIQQTIIGVARNGVALLYTNWTTDRIGRGIAVECGGRVLDSGLYYYSAEPPCLSTGGVRSHSPLVGFMLDGIPLYGPLDLQGTEAVILRGDSKLDECGGTALCEGSV